MGLFGGGGTKLPKWAKPFAEQGLSTAQNVFTQNQDNLNELSGIASDAFKANAGGFGTSPYVDNAQGAARAISNGYFLGSNPGQATYDRLQMPSAPGGNMPVKRPQFGGSSASSDPSMGLLSRMAGNQTPGAGTSLIRAGATGGNPGDDFASAVAQGQYLNNQPSAGLYGEMMDRSYSTSNPFLNDIIRQNDENVTKQANRLFASRGMGAGIGSAYADTVSQNLADSGNQIRFQDYTNAENRRLQAAGQSDAAFGAERGRMGDAMGLLSSNFNAGKDRALAAGQSLNQFDQGNRAQQLSAAQSLGQQYGGNQDRALEAAKAGDASQSNQVAQMLQALGLTGQLSDAEYAGYQPLTQLLTASATVPYAGLDAYQAALGNILGASRKTSGAGMGGGLLGAGAQLGSAAILASDRRLKTDIVKVGEFDDGLGVYDFNYADSQYGEGRHRGVMADEVAELRPWALGPLIDGEYATVNYGDL